jgi:hypothetical protein
MRRQYLSTPDAAATFDFLANYIQLKRIGDQDVPRVRHWMSNPDVFSKGGDTAMAAREDKADIVHEATHFLDATTTMWGLEYQYRKSLVTEALINGKDPAQALDVFMLNTAEIDSHHALMNKVRDGRLVDATMRHIASQHEFFGPLITVRFELGGSVIQDVPLSMLSVLETNAVANEVLSKLLDCELIADEEDRLVSMAHVESEFKICLNDQDLTEYTVFLHLIDRMCAGRSLKDKMTLAARLVRTVLDFSSFYLAFLAAVFSRTFVNEVAGAAITMDMSRGSSRPAALFKLIILLDAYLTTRLPLDRDQALQSFQDHPELLILELTGAPFDRSSVMCEIAFDNYMKRLGKDYGLLDHVLVPASVAHNRPLAFSGDYATNFFDYAIVDPLTPDGVPLGLLNKLDVPIVQMLDDRMTMLSKISALYSKTKPAKFFVTF